MRKTYRFRYRFSWQCTLHHQHQRQEAQTGLEEFGASTALQWLMLRRFYIKMFRVSGKNYDYIGGYRNVALCNKSLDYFLNCGVTNERVGRRWSPRNRMTPDEALRHPFIQTGLSTRQQNPTELRHSRSEANVNQDSHSSSSTSGSSHSRVHHQTVAIKGDKVKAKIIESRQHSVSTRQLDTNPNDSFSFLPKLH